MEIKIKEFIVNAMDCRIYVESQNPYKTYVKRYSLSAHEINDLQTNPSFARYVKQKLLNEVLVEIGIDLVLEFINERDKK